MGSFSQSVLNVSGGNDDVIELLNTKETLPSSISGTSAINFKNLDIPEFDIEKYYLIIEIKSLKDREGTSAHWVGTVSACFYLSTLSITPVSRTKYYAVNNVAPSVSSTAYGLFASTYAPSTRKLSLSYRANSSNAPASDLQDTECEISVYGVKYKL